jgi:hypothetical protein
MPRDNRVRVLVRLVALLVPVSVLLAGCSGHRRAGTGDVAFRLIWEGTSDLDLFVEDPGGACIFFGQRESAAGGVLDVDCNGGTEQMCERPVENVFWPIGTAPPGRYRFWVHAHSLVPAEAPLGYRLQVLRGTEVFWVQEGAVRGHQELQGPFVYSAPDGTVTRAPEPEDLPDGCDAIRHGVLTSGVG